MRGFPLEALLHFKLEYLWMIVPIVVGLLLAFLYFWLRQDTAKDFVRIAEQGLDAEKPVGPMAAIQETLATSNKLALLAHAAIYGVLAMVCALATLVFIVFGFASLFARGTTLTSMAWQIAFTVFFAVCTALFARACRNDIRQARAIDVAREVKNKTSAMSPL
jgi:hypothetical protein